MATSEEGITDISSGTYRLFHLPPDILTSQSEANLEAPRNVDSVGHALDLTITLDEARVPFVALVSPEAILNHGFAVELTSAITDPGLEDIRWIALASDGLDLRGDRLDTGNYLDDPATPAAGPLRIAHWSDPAVSVISTSALKNLSQTTTRRDSFPDLVHAGIREGLPVFLTRRLRYSCIADRWTGSQTAGTARPVTSVTGTSLAGIRPDPTISVVIRTMFERPWLLQRNLTALANEHRKSPILEAIVVSTADISRFSESAAKADGAFGTLPITTLQADEDSLPSRSAAMVAAIEAAQGDYVWFIDDDDWIATGSIEAIKDAVHALDRPILIGATEVFEEQFDGAALISSSPLRRYLPDEWYRAFTGWNFLPNCSLVLPRNLALQQIAACPITWDLGEDYALQLLLLTAPGAMVQVIDATIANISRRDDDNAVMMGDRVPWLRDLGSHISNISRDPSASTAAFWRLGAEIRKIPYPETDVGIKKSADETDLQSTPPSATTNHIRRRLRAGRDRFLRRMTQDPG